MGIGLVDPILPALSKQLKATPGTVELLFTSYLVVTAVAMLVTGWVSSRIGGKRTLVAGLVLIVAFSAAAGSANSIGGIIGFRAGWGLGNALFIATSLAVIIGAASGGFSGAIILYETALGIGIAMGPLVGGELGGISWRGPFYGVTVLMSIALVATLAFVQATPTPSILDPLKALRHRGLATMSVMALGYNWGFFTLLAYTPFPMHLGIHQLGYVFTGWGILVAIFAVFVAPRLQARFGTPRTLYANLALLSADLVVIAVFTSSQITLIIAVIVSGAFVGLNNTLTTQAVMLVAPVERPVASAGYGFVRFIGGGLAPYCAAKLASGFNVHVPFYLGAVTVALAIVVLATGHAQVSRAEQGTPAPGHAPAGQPAVAAGPGPAAAAD
jgi:MFS family permease